MRRGCPRLQVLLEYLGGRPPTYDGEKSLFTAGPLPFKAKEFVLMLTKHEANPELRTAPQALPQLGGTLQGDKSTPARIYSPYNGAPL